MTPLRWRFLLIGILVVGGVLAVYPPEDRIALGLDLKGGIHTDGFIEVDSAIKFEGLAFLGIERY